MPTVSFNKI